HKTCRDQRCQYNLDSKGYSPKPTNVTLDRLKYRMHQISKVRCGDVVSPRIHNPIEIEPLIGELDAAAERRCDNCTNGADGCEHGDCEPAAPPERFRLLRRFDGHVIGRECLVASYATRRS